MAALWIPEFALHSGMTWLFLIENQEILGGAMVDWIPENRISLFCIKRGQSFFIEMRLSVVCVTVFAVALAACDVERAAVDVIETDISLGDSPGIRWIDDRRVAVVADSGRRCTRRSGTSAILNRLAIYDVEAKDLLWYGPLGIYGFCFASGLTSYAVMKNDNGNCTDIEYDHVIGMIGEEKSVGNTFKGRIFDPYTCQPLPAIPEWANAAGNDNDSKFVSLRPEDGFVEFSRMTSGKGYIPVKIYRKTVDGLNSFNIESNFLDAFNRTSFGINLNIRFIPHKGAYLLYVDSFRMPFSERQLAQLWWLYPDGRIENYTSYTRTSRWPLANPGSVIPMKNAILFFGGKKVASTGISEGGVYRLNSSESLPIRLVSGTLGVYSVSPNGCRLAFGIDTRRTQDGPHQFKLQVLDLCKEREQ